MGCAHFCWGFAPTVYCCKTEDKEEQKLSECVNVYEPKPYTLDNYNDILKTRPPYMYGHKCACPCHSGGKCVFE